MSAVGAESRRLFAALQELATARGLRLVVEATGAELRIRLRSRAAVRYSSASPATAGAPLNEQARLLVDLLRGSPA